MRLLAAGILDAVPVLEGIADTVKALSLAALAIAGAYLLIHHTKKAAAAAGGDALDNSNGVFCPGCGVWNASWEFGHNGRCSLCGCNMDTGVSGENEVVLQVNAAIEAGDLATADTLCNEHGLDKLEFDWHGGAEASPFRLPGPESDGYGEAVELEPGESPFRLPEGYAGDPVDEDGDPYASGMRLILGPECLTTEERGAMDRPEAHAGEIWDCEYCGADFPSEDYFTDNCCPSCGHK